MESEHSGPMNIGNPNELSVNEFAQRVLEITGSSSPVTFGPRPPDDPSVRCPDISLAKRVLGWEPNVTLDEGLRRTAGYFAEALKR
jgi:dTDP-glucose 4,6-dehydratase